MSEAPTEDRLASGLEPILAKAVDRARDVRHGLLGVTAVDGSWSWVGAHGVLDPSGTPATDAARYPVASVTKLYTAAVVFRLVEKSSLRLGDRMVDLLPSDVTAGLHVFDGVDHTSEITVEHLLGHTSGLADYYEEAPPGGTSAQARLLAGQDAPMPFDEVLRVVRQDLGPHFPPHDLDAPRVKARYTDTNYQLLGAIIERVAAQPLHETFDQLIFEPLGLHHTSSYPYPPRSGGSPEPDASVWSKDTVLEVRGALTHQKADGGIVSNVTDQLSFMRALVSGDVFADPGTWLRMQERFHRVFFPVEYGLGVMRYAPPRWMSPGFAVPPLVGHTGSTATWLFHCPDLEIVLAGAFDVARPPLPFRFLPRVLRAVARVR
ncbi:MAG TPA: serine hydrolase domain-containing protein [Acidimicrobiia bacterium]|nr:serine hydrolase domain-containing protein [Acidimicrobiia bacterium]